MMKQLARNQGIKNKSQRTYLYGAGQVNRNRPMDELDLIQGLLKPCPSLGEIGLHRKSSAPKHIPELILLLISEDELNHS